MVLSVSLIMVNLSPMSSDGILVGVILSIQSGFVLSSLSFRLSYSLKLGLSGIFFSNLSFLVLGLCSSLFELSSVMSRTGSFFSIVSISVNFDGFLLFVLGILEVSFSPIKYIGGLGNIMLAPGNSFVGISLSDGGESMGLNSSSENASLFTRVSLGKFMLSSGVGFGSLGSFVLSNLGSEGNIKLSLGSGSSHFFSLSIVVDMSSIVSLLFKPFRLSNVLGSSSFGRVEGVYVIKERQISEVGVIGSGLRSFFVHLADVMLSVTTNCILPVTI
jgi:hypothetical protein